MGDTVRTINQKTKLIASNNAWIEGEAIKQLEFVSNMKGMTRVVGLPDLHPGRGYPIGMACLSDRVYPALVGSDIGCGIGLWQTDVPVRKAKLDKWEKRLRTESDPERWLDRGAELIEQYLLNENVPESLQLMISSAHSAWGSVGSGNHFVELQKISRIADESTLQQMSINPNQVLLLVHSGSRGLGEAILRDHVNEHSHAGIEPGSASCKDYMHRHDFALRWAGINRQVIAERMTAALSMDTTPILDVSHNFVERKEVEGHTGWLHRKGAVPTDKGYVVIPGSRGDSSYLVCPTNDADISLFSLAHGAGRKWLRTECYGRLKNRYSVSELTRTSLGSRVLCDNKELLYEEAPEAYKPIHTVISDLADLGLIKVIAELQPLLTYKSVSNKDSKRSHSHRREG
ncbi:MAG: RNA ligase RtcB family protein [Hahellaceae bacterium]|nr:RNA ligase RtcB family protein [Hahellaceae bacterium]